MKKIFLILSLLLVCPQIAEAQTSRNPCFINATGGCTSVGTSSPLPIEAIIAGATSNASSGKASTSTNIPAVSWLYGFNGTTWDQLQVDGSKNLKVTDTVSEGYLAAIAAAPIPDAANTTPVAGVGTGTCSAACVNTSLFSVDTTGYNGISVSVTSAGSGTITYQGSDDNVNWFNQTQVVSTSTGLSGCSASSTTTGQLSIPVRARYFRAQITAYTSGTITIAYTMRRTFANLVACSGQGVTISPNSTANAGLTSVVSGSAEATHVLKASAGNLYSVTATNLTATAGFLVVLNATSAPVDGAITPVECVPLPASGSVTINYNPGPAAVFSTGITAVISSAATCFTKTTGVITGFIRGSVS